MLRCQNHMTNCSFFASPYKKKFDLVLGNIYQEHVTIGQPSLLTPFLAFHTEKRTDCVFRHLLSDNKKHKAREAVVNKECFQPVYKLSFPCPNQLAA